MSEDRSYIDQNARERERLRALVERLDEDELRRPVNERWTEPEDVDWINDASRALIHAIPPREAARLALQVADETDARVATLPPDRLWPHDPDSPIYAVRARHRGLHLDEVESALPEDGSQAE